MAICKPTGSLTVTISENIQLPNGNIENAINSVVIKDVKQVVRRVDTISSYWEGTGVEILRFVADEASQTADEMERAAAAAERLKAAVSEQEEEPKASDLKSDSVASLARELGKITREMKTVVNQWKKSEGEEKEDLLKRLKELTAMKKEVEALL